MESKGKLVPKNERILRAAEAVFSKKRIPPSNAR